MGDDVIVWYYIISIVLLTAPVAGLTLYAFSDWQKALVGFGIYFLVLIAIGVQLKIQPPGEVGENARMAFGDPDSMITFVVLKLPGLVGPEGIGFMLFGALIGWILWVVKGPHDA